MKKLALITASLGVAAFSQAITWNILAFPSAPMGINASAYTTLGNTVIPLTLGNPGTGSNAITLLTPNGNILGNNQFGQINWEYEATNLGAPAAAVTYSIAGSVIGTGQVFWQEQVFGIDNLNNEIFINSASGVINSTNSGGDVFGLNGVINLAQNSYTKLRVKKAFTLTTGQGAGTHYASVGRINQAIQVVPEPASMTALSLGALALLRRRRAR